MTNLVERITYSGVPLHRYGHGEVGGPSQHHLAGGKQHREHLAVPGVAPDTKRNTCNGEESIGNYLVNVSVDITWITSIT